MAIQRTDLDWHGGEVEQDLRSAAILGVTQAAEYLLEVSRARVPLEEGRLERSGTATTSEADISATVSYDTPYAVRQHEELDYRHAPGRTAKYLEEPMHEEAETLQALIAAPIRRAMRE